MKSLVLDIIAVLHIPVSGPLLREAIRLIYDFAKTIMVMICEFIYNIQTQTKLNSVLAFQAKIQRCITKTFNLYVVPK